ncbi:MAG TPA: LysR substrate-binding domain-containing protein [Stellaceae bacterium]|jgi:DNA-binding transcriptional LysR family regulator|nr:LysR substrate-binding domain-containing protein [Stellaceae bacterium]
MSDQLQELSVFVRAAETGSFSKTAREFSLSQPSVSRMVASLEARLGIKLLLRTTRRVTPTDAGAVFLERTRRVLGDLDEAAHAARGVDSLHGVLRVVMSGAFGTREVIPRLPGFLASHPRLKVELVISDRTDDLVAEGADMALRLGRPVDSGFGARLLASAPRLVIAAPAYLAQRGAPETLADLSQHDCIVGPGLSGRSGWSFTRAGAVTSVVVEGRVQVASAEGVMACVRAALGIAVVSRWMCRAELERGDVRQILPDYELDSVDVHALYPAGPRPSPKVRAFSDYLAAELGATTPDPDRR